MDDCIERGAALMKLMEDGCSAKNLLSILDMPGADVAPVVHGWWEPCFTEDGRCRWGIGKCSNCGKEYYACAINRYQYCPVCGAKMDGGADHAAD